MATFDRTATIEYAPWRVGYQDRYLSIIDLLDRAIPPEDLEWMIRASREQPYIDPVTGGNIYGKNLSQAVSRVASYNNTRKDPQEIIDWYERAMLLA